MKVTSNVQTAAKSVPVRRSTTVRRFHGSASANGDGHTPVHTAARLPAIQPKLRVGAADDPLEREAEAMAARVVSMPAPGLAAPAAAPGRGEKGGEPGGEKVCEKGAEQGARPLRREAQPNLDALEDNPKAPAGQEDVTVSADEDVTVEDITPDDLKEMESGTPEEPPGGTGDAPPLRPARGDGLGTAVGPEGGAAPADVDQRVQQPGSGRPLPAPVRAFMEPRFGYDFSDVRIHDAPADRQTASRIGARAFTHGRRIWIGETESVNDKALLAHELTHVVQQTRRRPAGEPARRQIESGTSAPTLRRASWFAEKAEGYARHVPGYTLISVILGKSPITGERVQRSATNMLGGFLGLIPGGTMIFDRLNETGAIDKAFEWVSSRLAALNISWSRVSGLIDRVIDAFPTWSPLERITEIFGPLVRDIVTFAGEIKDKVLEFIVKGALKLAGPYADKIWSVIQAAGSALGVILKDPLGFAKNLVRSVVGGFGLFASNIYDHLKRGLLGWLFGAVSGAGIELPAKLDLKGLLSIGLQVLGLTYANFRKTLIKRLGPTGERTVGFIEKSVEFVTLLAKEGFAGIWQKLLSYIDNFKQTMMNGIQDLVMTSIVNAGLSWLAGLSNPVGAIIKVIMSIYNMIVAFIERLEQIKAVAMGIFNSIGAIAAGKVDAASKFIEKTIGDTVPVVISFLAAVLGLGGISGKIRGVIKKLQKPVLKAMDKMVRFIVSKAKKLMSKLLKKLNGKRKMPGARFEIGKEKHALTVEADGKKPALFVASKKQKLSNAGKTQTKVGKAGGKEPGAEQVAQLGETVTGIDEKARSAVEKLPLNTPGNKSGRKDNADATKVVTASAAEISTAAAKADKPFETVEPTPGAEGKKKPCADIGGKKTAEDESGPLVRFAVMRMNFEGDVAGYATLKKDKTAKAKACGLPELGKQYEADHIPTRKVLDVLQAGLAAPATSTAAKPAAATATKSGQSAAPAPVRIPENATPTRRASKATPAAAAQPAAQPAASASREFGLVRKSKLKGLYDTFPAIIIHGSAHLKKRTKDSDVAGEAKQVSAAFAAGDLAGTKLALQAHVGNEIQRTVDAYADDPATDFAERATKLGLPTLKKRALHELDIETIRKENGQPVGVHGKPKLTQGSKSLGVARDPDKDLFFNSHDQKSGRKNPDFSDKEGGRYAYNNGNSPNTVMGFIELDHIVDRVYATTPAAKATRRQKVHDFWSADIIGPRPAIKNDNVYEGRPLQRYDANAVDTILISARVHKTVDKKTSSDVTNRIEEEAKKHGANLSKDTPDEDVKSAARDVLRAVIKERTTDHAGAVEKAYPAEKRAVMAQNEALHPGMGPRAGAEMDKIIARVGKSLSEMSTASISLV